MAVRRYEVLDTPPDHAFDRVTAIAAKHFGVPISIVTIVDSDRIWFKSAHGFEGVAEVGRDPGLCASAILQDEAWVVENAPLDPRALANPLVAGEFGLKFYAGWPLRTRDGHNLGTLCVIDRQPRKFTSDEAATLKEMAGIVVDELELRLSALRTTRAERLRRLEAERQAEILQRSMLAPVTPEVAGFEVAGRLLSGRGGDGGGAFYDCFELPDRVEGAVAVVVGEVHDDAGGLAAGVALARYMLRTAALSGGSPSEALEALDRALFVGESEAAARRASVLVVFAEHASGGVRLTASGAGNPPRLLLRAGSVELLAPPGRLAGWYPDVAFGETTTALRPGESVVLVTRGLGDSGARSGSELLEVAARGSGGSQAGADALVGWLRGSVERDELPLRGDTAVVALTAR